MFRFCFSLAPDKVGVRVVLFRFNSFIMFISVILFHKLLASYTDLNLMMGIYTSLAS